MTTDTKRPNIEELDRLWEKSMTGDGVPVVGDVCKVWDAYPALSAYAKALSNALRECRDCLLCPEGADVQAAIDAADAALESSPPEKPHDNRT